MTATFAAVGTLTSMMWLIQDRALRVP